MAAVHMCLVGRTYEGSYLSQRSKLTLDSGSTLGPGNLDTVDIFGRSLKTHLFTPVPLLLCRSPLIYCPFSPVCLYPLYLISYLAL